MIDRRTLVGLPLLALLAAPALASMSARYEAAAFDTARKAGKPVLVEVTAPWCPTCKAQKPILADLRAMPKFKDLQVFEVDFDSQKDALRALGVQSQSTLVVFRGGKEVGRSTGDTRKDSIEALLSKAVAPAM